MKRESLCRHASMLNLRRNWIIMKGNTDTWYTITIWGQVKREQPKESNRSTLTNTPCDVQNSFKHNYRLWPKRLSNKLLEKVSTHSAIRSVFVTPRRFWMSIGYTSTLDICPKGRSTMRTLSDWERLLSLYIHSQDQLPGHPWSISNIERLNWRG